MRSELRLLTKKETSKWSRRREPQVLTGTRKIFGVHARSSCRIVSTPYGSVNHALEEAVAYFNCDGIFLSWLGGELFADCSFHNNERVLRQISIAGAVTHKLFCHTSHEERSHEPTL